jgi:hypothetical protein
MTSTHPAGPLGLGRISLNRRRLLQLTGVAAAGVATAGMLPAKAGAAPVKALATNPPSAGGLGPVSIVSRRRDHLDAFAVGADGGVYTAAWQPGDDGFKGWWRIGDLEVAPCAPVSAVSRSLDKLDIFVAGLDGRVYTAAWAPGQDGFRGWWTVGNLVTTPHAGIGVVSRSRDKLDVFATGLDGRIHTAAWQPGDSGFRGWWPIGDLIAPPGAPVSAVSRTTDQMDIFVTAENGYVHTAAWAPGQDAFHGWWTVADGRAKPGAPVSAVSRSTNKLDIFITGTDGRIYTAAWQPGDDDFRGWWPIGNVLAPQGAAVSAVSRSRDKMDIFVTGSDGRIYTAAWAPGDSGFKGWWTVAGGQSRPGTPIGAVSRSLDRLDVIAPGLDARVQTAAWAPGQDDFHGWWTIGSLVTGMTDPEVSRWRRAGTAYSLTNSLFSEESQGVASDGSAWFLVSNKMKSIRKVSDAGSVLREVKITAAGLGGHVGAPSYYGGWIYVPLQHPWGVWRIRTDLTGAQWIPLPVPERSGMSWCGVNPLNGRLYTSEFDIWNNARVPIRAYDRDTLVRHPQDDMLLGSTPKHLDRIQGGVFTAKGRLILTRSDPNRVFCFSSVTGHCFGALDLGDFGSTGSEVEGVGIRTWKFGNTVAPVHIMELDNDGTTRDDLYVHSFSVPQPDRL